jgi:hypothetical protein
VDIADAGDAHCQTPADDCRTPALSSDPQRFATAANDARDFLVDRTTLTGRSCVSDTKAGSLTMATAAHLSARFTWRLPAR